MDLSSVPGHQWLPNSFLLAASSSSVNYQPMDYTDVAVETMADASVVFERHCTPASSCLVSPPPMTNRFQKEQLALRKLFDLEQRLQEAVHAATRHPAPSRSTNEKKQGNRLGIYKCQFCNYTSDRSYNTKQHEKTHSVPPIRPHKCIICERGFVRKYDLKIHHQMHIRDIRHMMKSCGLVLV
ncbi:hypothetical protein BC940DRAFT_336160 [Gongronella butleri]|nr:hypothetical protein BC940DRAFT_336160 [Gongronella butleri]